MLPAVIDAPITSSELVPAGISSPVTCSFGWSLFHASTTALPQVTSSALFEYQILIGPVGPAAAAALPLAAASRSPRRSALYSPRSPLAAAPAARRATAARGVLPPPLLHAVRIRTRAVQMPPSRSQVRNMCTSPPFDRLQASCGALVEARSTCHFGQRDRGNGSPSTSATRLRAAARPQSLAPWHIVVSAGRF